MYKLWLNINEEGEVLETYGGHHFYIMPPDDGIYEHYFEVDDYTFKHISFYKVENGQLVVKE